MSINTNLQKKYFAKKLDRMFWNDNDELCSSAAHKQNDSISLRFSDSVQCRRGYYFRAWVLYFNSGTYYDVNIKQLCSSSMYKHNV